MKVLVTGGTGFVGSAIVRHLLKANYEVRVLAHHKKNHILLEDLAVEIVSGDITNPDAVDKAVKSCSIVFDVASVYTFLPFWEKEAKALYKINVGGITNMLNASLKHNVQRFIHTSTIATIGKRPDGKPSDENTGFDFRRASHYARSKYLAEQEILKFCAKGLPAIILNPAIIIGERDYKPTPSGEIIVKFLNRKYPGYFDTIWSVADVDDVARAHIAAIDRGKIGGRYILCNKKHYSMREIFGLLEEVSGVKAPHLKIPYRLLLGFVYADEFLSYTVFKKKPLMPSEGVKFCRMNTIYNNSKALNELGYESTPFKETLAKAVNWYRMSGYIEPRGFLRLKANGSKKVKLFMKKTGMDMFTDKLNPGTLFFFLVVKTLQLLEKAGLRPSEDGWRKTTRCYLRAEHSKFGLAVFGLDFWSDSKSTANKSLNSVKQHIIARLSKFLQEHPQLHWQLKWYRFSAKRENWAYSDIVLAEFDNSGALNRLEPAFDSGLDFELENALLREIIKAYNRTRNLKDKKRPIILNKILKKRLLRYSERDRTGIFTNRILSASFLHFETIPDINKRYHAPLFIKFKHPGFGFLNILCRLTEDFTEADFWFQLSHIPADGVPMQEVLNDLKRQWGTCQALKLPAGGYEKRKAAELCSTNNHKYGVYHIDDFVDFRPLLKLRRELNKKYTSKASGSVTLAALFIWKLAHYSAFDDIKFAVPVDLKATHNRERTLSFVFIRPSIYFDRDSPYGGFLKFQRDFNRQLRNTHKRRSVSYKLLESYALTAPAMYAFTIRCLRRPLCEFVGTVGITIIKKADLFIAPSSDVHTQGFIAISNFLISGEDGSRVCNISIKGPKGKIENYMKAIKEVVASQE
jgi:dihydroflavonol-4-reductase